ncbi:MAG TPA: pitrilysin family protein [Thermomicrobiaceae bacterium]|nr:pitrilysin family protein [Thermomicrobiaceae bacterium]
MQSRDASNELGNAAGSIHHHVLDNGLTVLIKTISRVPVASFWVWYRVGARNEVPGITGISHWVEHMLFKGTPTYQPGEIFRTVNKHGGTLNGFTWIDYTAYYETLPAARILLGADIESDRMRNALFDPDNVQSERTVILSERQGNENQPTFFLREDVVSTSFKAHPYGQGVIGWTSDLERITREDLFAHYRRYYVPNNATVVVAGDVDPERVLEELNQRFGGIPAGDEPPAVRTIEPVQQGPRRVQLRRPAPTASFLRAYRAPAAADPDLPAVVVLDSVLSGGKGMSMGGSGTGRSSRLYQALVASGLASSAGSSVGLTIDPYLFTVSATLIPGVEAAQVEDVIDRELERVRTELVPDDELQRAVKQLRAQWAYGEESVASQASLLGSLQTVAPGLTPDTLLGQLTEVTAENVRRVASRYLALDQSTTGWLEPAGEGSGGSRYVADFPFSHNGRRGAGMWGSPEQSLFRPAFFSDGSAPEPAPAFTPSLDLVENDINDGIRFIGHHDPESQAAVVALRLPVGSRVDDVPGLARFTGQVLARGTARRSYANLNEELDNLGAAIGVGVSREYVDISAKCLREDFTRVVQLMSEVVLEPTFPEEQIERARSQTLTALRQMHDSTRSRAQQALRETIYPAGHPYHHPTLGTAQSLGSLRREQLVEFHQRWYQPAGAIMSVAGGVPVEEARRVLGEAFAGWRLTATPPEIIVPPVVPPASRLRRTEAVPGKSQADIVIGLPAIARDNPDYDALRMVNLVLGGLGLMGRLGASVRERQGMAYYASSGLQAGLVGGLWYAYAGVNPANVERAIDSIFAELELLLRDGVQPDELADGKSYLTGSLPLGLESSDSIAGLALDIAFYGLGLDYVERIPERVGKLDLPTLQAVAQRYLLPDRMVVAVAGPPEEAPSPPAPLP